MRIRNWCVKILNSMFTILYRKEIRNLWDKIHPYNANISSSLPLDNSTPQNNIAPIPEDNKALTDPNNLSLPANQTTPVEQEFIPQPSVGGTMIIGKVASEKKNKVDFEELSEITLKTFSSIKDSDGKADMEDFITEITKASKTPPPTAKKAIVEQAPTPDSVPNNEVPKPA